MMAPVEVEDQSSKSFGWSAVIASRFRWRSTGPAAGDDT
jgi:hypothetical protein